MIFPISRNSIIARLPNTMRYLWNPMTLTSCTKILFLILSIHLVFDMNKICVRTFSCELKWCRAYAFDSRPFDWCDQTQMYVFILVEAISIAAHLLSCLQSNRHYWTRKMHFSPFTPMLTDFRKFFFSVEKQLKYIRRERWVAWDYRIVK